jgi:hypothetical protein
MRKSFLQGMGLSILTVLLIVSCKKDNPVTPIYYGYNYFPNRVGHYVIYNVDSIVVNQLHAQPIDTFKYQIKEVIDSFFTDGSGRPTQRIVRYKRADSTKAWVIQKVWSGNLTTTTAERTEDNIRFLKLTFPIKLSATWNGNINYTIGDWEYQYTNVNGGFTLGKNYFDSTLTVLQDSNLNLVQHQFYLERYAANVGLIYKDVIDLSYSGPSGIFPALIQPNLVITPSILDSLNSGSVVYTENYVSSGN